MGKIIDHTHPLYRQKWQGMNKYNGAFYYSKEIVKNIIPEIETDRPWVTIHIRGLCLDRAIVFIHNNLHPERYEWMSGYKDLILVCSQKETVKRVKHLGHAVFLPLSIDLAYIEQFRRDKMPGSVAYVGRRAKMKLGTLPEGVTCLYGIKRQDLLPIMAEYESVYAVGRTAIEAKALGCKVLPYDERFPNPAVWKVMDNKEAVPILQRILDGIDGKEKKSVKRKTHKGE